MMHKAPVVNRAQQRVRTPVAARLRLAPARLLVAEGLQEPTKRPPARRQPRLALHKSVRPTRERAAVPGGEKVSDEEAADVRDIERLPASGGTSPASLLTAGGTFLIVSALGLLALMRRLVA